MPEHRDGRARELDRSIVNILNGSNVPTIRFARNDQPTDRPVNSRHWPSAQVELFLTLSLDKRIPRALRGAMNNNETVNRFVQVICGVFDDDDD